MLKQNKIPFRSKTTVILVIICSLFFSTSLLAQKNIGTIFLTTPFNEQKIYVSYPLFSWSSTISFQSMSDITYQFKLVEVFSHQNAATAILSNSALYEKEVGTSTILQYPLDAPELQNCKRYAWQVVAYDKNQKIIDENDYKVTYTNKIAQSEPYLFQTPCHQSSRISNPNTSQSYLVLAKTVDNFVFQTSNTVTSNNYQLNIKYTEDYAAYELKYTIYSWDRTAVLTNTSSNASVQLDNGWNYLSINLPTNIFSANTIYQLEVETPKGDIYKAKFEISQ